jgi:hypothetical protein
MSVRVACSAVWPAVASEVSPAHGLVGRELRLDAGLDGGLAQHPELARRRPRDGADRGQALLEAPRRVGEREGAGDHGGAPR